MVMNSAENPITATYDNEATECFKRFGELIEEAYKSKTAKESKNLRLLAYGYAKKGMKWIDRAKAAS